MKLEIPRTPALRELTSLLAVLVAFIGVLSFGIGVLVARDIMRQESYQELRTMSEPERVKVYGRAVESPSEDYNALFDSQIFRGTGQGGFVTGALFTVAALISFPVTLICGLVALYCVQRLDKSVGSDKGDPEA